jgi:hypothetical protein
MKSLNGALEFGPHSVVLIVGVPKYAPVGFSLTCNVDTELRRCRELDFTHGVIIRRQALEIWGEIDDEIAFLFLRLREINNEKMREHDVVECCCTSLGSCEVSTQGNCDSLFAVICPIHHLTPFTKYTVK